MALGLVPVVGIGLLLVLLLAPGGPGANAHGPPPPKPVFVPTVPAGATIAPVRAEDLEGAYEAGRRFAERRGARS